MYSIEAQQFYRLLDNFTNKSEAKQKDDVCRELLTFLRANIGFTQFFDTKYALISETDLTLSESVQYYAGKIKKGEIAYRRAMEPENIGEICKLWKCTECEARQIIYGQY